MKRYYELCDLLGIKYPIFQGGMAWAATYHLASSVSEAGGLGIIAAMNSNGEQLRESIRELKKRTKKPFGVNIMLMSPYKDEVAKVVIEEKVPVITTGGGNPSKYMKEWLDNGIKVIPVVASVALGKMLEKKGATALIAEGLEAGGHIGPSTTMTLIPMLKDEVNIPIIAAGGIADGRGFLASLVLGASGVQMGTRFLVSDDSIIHENYKNEVLKAKDRDTIVTGNRLGHPVRSLKTKFSNHFKKLENNPEVTLEELETIGLGALRRAVIDGDLEDGCFMSGIIAGLVKKKESSVEILESMFKELVENIEDIKTWEIK